MQTELKEFLARLKTHGTENRIPNVSETNARFLADLIRISGAKKVLEIGTANGYSTIHLADALRETGGSILSIEFSLDAFEAAVRNIEAAGLTDYCKLVHANALEYLPTLSGNFDFVFIDGMKRRTRDFFELSYPKVRPGGFVIVDDVIKYREKMEDFFLYLEEHSIDYNILPIDPDDGVLMVVKSFRL